MAFHWLPDDNLAGPSFIDRARLAPDDDDFDFDFPVRDDFAPAVLPQAVAEETSLQRLVRHWMNERHAPDILPGQEALLGSMLDHVRKQVSTVAVLLGSVVGRILAGGVGWTLGVSDDVQLLRADPDSSEDEHFRIMLVQTEVERVKFVIRSYIRTRLHKIEKYARYISATPAMHERLSKAELEHAQRYARLVEYHFDQCVLQSLPPEQRSLEDNMAFMPPMVPEPDRLRPVFAHALEKCPPVHLPDGSPMEMEKGQISLTPYYVVEQLLARGEVELV
ncbi:DNA replication complex GINS protein sld5 [Grifola frondosa]|uniref:DNA replication complex GINS protein SLD5 n=1 Tax=Grifola frondosa TaxID=5627 RepID=A0A1C7M8J5_GRIFR|nr:DNA replication complex GINS protein sld5 [Grifola frondosa]